MVNPRATSSGQDQVAAFQLGDPLHPVGATHVVAMIPDPATKVASLFHMCPDAASPGGWTSTPIPDTAGVVDFVVANLFNPANHPGDPGNVAELYCRRASGVEICRLAANGTWQASGSESWTAPMQVDYGFGLLDGTITTVYCYNRAAHSISWRMTVTSGSQYTVTTGMLTGMPPTVTGPVCLTVLDNGSMVVTACLSGTQVASYRPAKTSGPVGTAVITQLAAGVQVAGVRAMGSFGKAAFAVVSDTDGSLWTVASAGVTKIWDKATLGPADQVAELQVFPGTVPLLDLLVTSGGTLWLIHQVHQPDMTITNPLDATEPVFAPPTPLQPGIATASVAFSAVGGDSRTVVTVDQAGAVAVLSQPPGGQAWARQPVLLAGSEAEQVDTYRVQLSFTDANGIPAAGLPVSIAAASPILTLASKTAQTLGPTPSGFTTDAYGRVIFAVVAEGLATPDLTVTAAGLTGPVTVSAAAQVQDFLAGKGTLHAAGNQLTAGTLQGATANGQPLAPGLDHDTAATAVGLMATAIGTGNGHPPAATGSLPLGTRPGQLLGSARVGDLEISLSDFGADVWHAIKTAAVAVTDVVRDVTGAITAVAVKLEGWGTALIDATVKTITDAINVVHSVFNWIKAAVEDAIAWLREGVLELLHDTAALASQMFTWLSAAPAFLAATAQTYRGQVNAALDGAREQMKASLTNTAVLPQGTLTDLAGTKPSQLQGRLGDSPAGVDPASFSSNDHANWLLHKVLDELSGSLAPVSGPAARQLTTLNTTFTKSLTASLGEFDAAIKNFWSQTFGISTTAKTANPQGFKGTGVAAVTSAMVPVVDALIKLTETVVGALLDLVTAAANLLKDYVFDATLGELPLIGALLRDTAIGDLSFGKLICLIVAFPVAFIYQLSHPAGANSLASLLPAGSGASGQLGADDDTIDVVRRWLSTGAQGVWAFFDVILDVASVSNPLTSAIDIITPILIGTVTCPGSGAPFANVPDATTADRFQLASWASGFLPPLASAGLYLDPTEHQTLRNTYNGPMLISGMGLYIMILGIVANGLSRADAGAWVSTILGGLTVVGGVLGAKELTEATEEGTLIVKIIIDFFGGMGAAVGMAVA